MAKFEYIKGYWDYMDDETPVLLSLRMDDTFDEALQKD